MDKFPKCTDLIKNKDMDKCPRCYDRKKLKKYKQCYLCATRPYCEQCDNSGLMYACDDMHVPCLECHRGDGYF